MQFIIYIEISGVDLLLFGLRRPDIMKLQPHSRGVKDGGIGTFVLDVLRGEEARLFECIFKSPPTGVSTIETSNTKSGGIDGITISSGELPQSRESICDCNSA